MGYDITDYKDIDELMGSMDDFDELRTKLRENGLCDYYYWLLLYIAAFVSGIKTKSITIIVPTCRDKNHPRLRAESHERRTRMVC